VTCRVKEGYVKSEQLVGYFVARPSRRGLQSGLALTGAMCFTSQTGQLCLSVSATPAWLTILTLLLKASATVTDYRRHRRTLSFLPVIISLFIVCVGIIRNNSLVKGGPSFEPGFWDLSHSTAHGARVRWPLSYMGKRERELAAGRIITSMMISFLNTVLQLAPVLLLYNGNDTFWNNC